MIITCTRSFFAVDELLQWETTGWVMRKEFFVLMTILGICEDICMISPRETETIRLTYSTMERQNDGISSKLNGYQNPTQNVLYLYYSR